MAKDVQKQTYVCIYAIVHMHIFHTEIRVNGVNNYIHIHIYSHLQHVCMYVGSACNPVSYKPTLFLLLIFNSSFARRNFLPRIETVDIEMHTLIDIQTDMHYICTYIHMYLWACYVCSKRKRTCKLL